MYVEKETRHLCSYVILNLDETQRHEVPHTGRPEATAGPHAGAPHETGMCSTWPGPCSPLSAPVISAHYEQKISTADWVFHWNWKQWWEILKFLSGEVSQPQAGPAGRGDQAGSGSGKAGAWASQPCWGKNTTKKSQLQFVLTRNSVPSFPQKPHLTGEKPSIQCQGMCMLFGLFL